MFIDRVSILEYLQENKPNGIGVEIGVAGWRFSKNIVRYWKNFSHLYLVDLWRYQETGYNDGCNLPDEKQEERYLDVKKYFDTKYNNVTTIREWSHLAAETFPDNFFDFVYIDANHSYSGCKKDLESWYPKVKTGGVFAGHDYSLGPEDRYCVKKAVDEFFTNHIVYETTLKMDRDNNWEGKSWIVIK
jgi:hypothetical protein